MGDIKDPQMAVVYDWVYHIKYILNMTQHDWPTNSFVDHSNLGLRLENSNLNHELESINLYNRWVVQTRSRL